jgi:hypothetical protein
MIIAFSGRKTAGKNTCGNYVLGTILWMSGVVKNTYKISDKGDLLISDIFGDTSKNGVFDLKLESPSFQDFLNKEVYPIVKVYSFADPLKEMCRDIFGLDPHLLWGSNEQKNTPTNLKWEDVPTKTSKKGYMSVREVLEYVGTDLFRTMYQNVWRDALIRKIKNDNSMFAIITDARFENEFEAIQNNGGKVIKLTRGIAGEKNDVDKYENYDHIIDNKDLTIPQQNLEIDKILQEIRLHNLFGIKQNVYN